MDRIYAFPPCIAGNTKLLRNHVAGSPVDVEAPVEIKTAIAPLEIETSLETKDATPPSWTCLEIPTHGVCSCTTFSTD